MFTESTFSHIWSLFGSLLSMGASLFQSTLQEVILFCCVCVFMNVYSSSHSKISDGNQKFLKEFMWDYYIFINGTSHFP